MRSERGTRQTFAQIYFQTLEMYYVWAFAASSGDGTTPTVSVKGKNQLGEPTHTDSQVDRTFLIEVFLLSAAHRVLRAVHHEQLPPKFSSNTRLTKGVLWPKKSIRSIK